MMNNILGLLILLCSFSFDFSQDVQGNGHEEFSLKEMQEKLKQDPRFIECMGKLYAQQRISLPDFRKNVYIVFTDLFEKYETCLKESNQDCESLAQNGEIAQTIMRAYLIHQSYGEFFDKRQILADHEVTLNCDLRQHECMVKVNAQLRNIVKQWKQEQE